MTRLVLILSALLKWLPREVRWRLGTVLLSQLYEVVVVKLGRGSAAPTVIHIADSHFALKSSMGEWLREEQKEKKS